MWTLLQEIGIWIAHLNLVLVVIIFCSILAAGVFFERVLYFKKIDIDTGALLLRIRQEILDGNIVEAMNVCEQMPGAVSNIVKAGLCKHTRAVEYIENAMEQRGLIEIAKMEKNARMLSIIAHIAPLIGLLGTVIGFIKAFGEMRVSSLVEISATQIGEAMEYALVTTAAGLVVAIPAVIAYNYIISRIEAMTVEMQATANEVVDLLESRHGE
ncbi:MAG: MotA/TolQ/ExbB proton channel family protein [Verrucomicrobia bacterium]|nr:MotA/TolQ/ExbB proton channel family protein [Verrucomicrobiota bacterium]MBS0637224.1 MotA/TolQ/ExbB proton channel family protein [Verrucomicrobiota bacterium]